MKSSRSTSSKLPSRFARRLMSESSDDSDDGASSNAHMDSARAEKAFSRRKRQTPTLNGPNVKNDSTRHIQSDRTLFRLSDTSDSEVSDSKIDKKQPYHNKTTSPDGSINESIFKPSKRDMAKYRNILHSSDDEESKNSNFDESSDDSSSKKSPSLIESDESGEECLLEEYMDKPTDTTNIIANESFKPLRKFKTNQAIILDSSEESQTMTKNICNETNLILESDSEDNVISSPHKTFQMPKNVNREESHIEAKLNDLSLIEPSDSDDELSAHQKSTVTSSKQNRPFIDDLKFSNTIYSLHDPISQSSILEYPNFDNVNIEQSSKIKANDKIIETIDLIDDSPKTSKLCLPPKHNDLTIDLTDEKVNGKSSVLSKDISINDSKKPMSGDFQSLKMEKIRLEEILRRFTNNIANMKNTMKMTNLNLLPDGGYKLKRAIVKEESALIDTRTQFNNVLKKLEGYPDEPKVPQKPHSNYLQTLDINNALTKKAAGNIDIKAMGDKALNTYRTQQTMTLDVLNSLHKSLGTCPSSDILADDPQTLKVELMPHQKHAIAWLMWREIQKPHGGILADDMGLGKTLTMISLILKVYETRKDQSEDSETDDSFEDSEDSNLNSFKGGTLIVCPSSLIGQWENEIKSKVKPRVLDAIKYYGASRESSARKLAKKHIVITTYNTVMWDHKNNKTSPLFQIKWCRIILDEAHTIRNPKSQTSVAICSLSSINRWALTGTPIHNKEADFYALLKFIRCRPFDEWAVWKRWVGNNDDAGKNRLSLLIKALMLRRTKEQLKETTSFDLPSKTFHTIKIDLFKEEKEAYEKVLQFSSSLFAKYLYEKAEKENAVERGFPVINKAKYLSKNSDNNIFKDHPELDKLFKQLLNNKNIQAHHILVLILRLRQLCCHPCLLKNMLEDESLKVDGIQDVGDVDIVDHLSRMSIGVPSAEKDSVKNSNVIFKETWISSKIKAVCDMVKEKVLCTEDKAVIVSQWPSVLNLVNKQLSQYNVKTEIFSGVVPVLLRNKMICEFNKVNGGPKILLLSLTAGGVGLNLVVANHLFLVDIHNLKRKHVIAF